jgi:5,10-methylenetetrahydromethanopterin reductase
MTMTTSNRAHDLSIYVLPGRATDPTIALTEAANAEAAGFGGIYVSERLDVKDAAVVCGALVATTEHLRVGTALIHQGTRHPLTLASMAATLQLLSRGRFVLGLGRGLGALAPSLGVARPTLASLEHLVTTVRRLWEGERITETGPAGSFRGLRFTDLPSGPPPPILFGTVGPKGLELAGRLFDGVILHPFLTAEAVNTSVEIVRRAAEGAGRDPQEVRVVATLVAAPGLGTEREDIAVRARAISYLQVRGLGELLVAANGWDPAVLGAIRDHPTLRGRGIADTALTRSHLVDAAETIPDHWFDDGAATGSAVRCVHRGLEYRAAGADEILLHGTFPTEAAAMIPAWLDATRRDS